MKEQVAVSVNQVELAKWLLLRSDHLRSSYANRALLILTADAMLVASLFVLLQASRSALDCLAALGLATVLILVALSIAYAFFATGTLRENSRKETGCDGPARLFLSPADSESLLASFEVFKSHFLALDDSGTLAVVLSELQMDLVLQGRRYNHLKRSVFFFLVALATFVLFAVVFSS